MRSRWTKIVKVYQGRMDELRSQMQALDAKRDMMVGEIVKLRTRQDQEAENLQPSDRIIFQQYSMTVMVNVAHIQNEIHQLDEVSTIIRQRILAERQQIKALEVLMNRERAVFDKKKVRREEREMCEFILSRRAVS